MSAINLKVNGRAHTVDVDPATPLLYVLSDDLELRGPKFGCGLGQCGACTVIVRSRAVRSCVTPVGTLIGVILTAKAFLDQNPKAAEPQIQQAMSTVLCRCFAHTRMLRAIKRYAQE